MSAAQLSDEEAQALSTALQQFAAQKDDSLLRDIFAVFDRNHDGKINKGELKTVMSTIAQMGDSDVDNMLNEADTNKDGMIDLRELAAVLKRS